MVLGNFIIHQTPFLLCYDLSNGMNKKLHTAAVFVDFAKAFDSINHVKLVNKLKMFSLETKAVLWIKDYLSNRMQRVMVNGDCSNWDTIKYGVPQGSVLGRLLFIMFTNDLVNCIRNSNVLLYADDTVIYRNDFCFDRNYRNIQGDLNCLHKWCFTNRLTINGRKTKVVIFGNNPKKVVNKPLHINRTVLSYKKQYKYLGVILDSKLNFEAHCKEIIKTFSFKPYLYRQVLNCLNDLATKLVLKTMVLSYLDYGSMFLLVRTIEEVYWEYFLSIGEWRLTCKLLAVATVHTSNSKVLCIVINFGIIQTMRQLNTSRCLFFAMYNK